MNTNWSCALVLILMSQVFVAECCANQPGIVPAAGRITKADGTPFKGVLRVEFRPQQDQKNFATLP